MHFKKIISKERKPNKIWVDQGIEFYNQSFKDFFKINNIEMYSTFNEEKSVAAERFIRTLKNKIYKHMTATSKNVYFNVLDDIVNKYNTVHRTIKMKPINVTSDCFAEYNEESNKKSPKFKVGDLVRISKYKNILAKGYVPYWSIINDLNGEEIIGSFMKKNCKRLIKNSLEQRKYLKEQVINCLLNGKDMTIHLIVGLIKKTLYNNE